MKDAFEVSCPNCQAKPGEPCTQPTANGRTIVQWLHLARINSSEREKGEHAEGDGR